ncbi:MAG: ATP-binding cassette domain-containing protein, partial [Cytophagaceae bacterium]
MTALPYSYKSPLLTLDHVSLHYGNDLILRDLNAQVLDVVRPGLSQGQVVGIYGRSGIGKSVLCRLLAGLAAPSTGTVLVGEAQQPVQAGMVGYVQQRYPLFNHYSLLDNLLLAARRQHDPAEAQARVEHYLGRFGL